jgi:ComF family protein
VCGTRLVDASRIPVCAACLKAPQPLDAEHFCRSCRTPFSTPYPLDESGRCGLCRAGLNQFDSAYAYSAYEGVLRELIHLFKYGRVRPLARVLSAYLSAALPREERFDMVVPMPLYWVRRWRRGFNQSELLAREVAKWAGIPVVRAVRRARSTASQASLSRAERRRNVRGAFALRRGAEVSGRRVLLVDDVLTTGATANACAETLKRAGARYVAVLAVARADHRRVFVPDALGWPEPAVSVRGGR